MKVTEEERLKKVYEHPDFILCGVKISEMIYDESNQLFFLSEGKCRITSKHILAAMSSKIYKETLEKEVNFRN